MGFADLPDLVAETAIRKVGGPVAEERAARRSLHTISPSSSFAATAPDSRGSLGIGFRFFIFPCLGIPHPNGTFRSSPAPSAGQLQAKRSVPAANRLFATMRAEHCDLPGFELLEL
ncbi:MAG TPA: hypothetical protein VKW08_20920 [Xanthobacteraceae bacterium]|nr:hypothetical protein [Xanthobacteraceae bacterium]